MSELDAARAPMMAHLLELRGRLMICAWAFLLATAASYYFAPQIYNFLATPLANAFDNSEHRRLIYTNLTEAFVTYLKLAMFAGFFVSFPVLAWQIYAFLAPGLYKRERRMILPYLVIAPLLFFAGAALAYYDIFPLAWKFFVSFENPSGALPIELEARVGDYLSLVMQLLIIFGLSFQLPVVLTLLAQTGVVDAASLARGRRYAIVIIVVVAGVITPPDIFSQIALSVPLYLLYECSILSAKWIQRGNENARYQSNPSEPGGI